MVHSNEAFLAAGTIFIFIHFYSAHARPSFPADEVIFSGSLPLEHYMKERPAEYEIACSMARCTEVLRPAAVSGKAEDLPRRNRSYHDGRHLLHGFHRTPDLLAPFVLRTDEEKGESNRLIPPVILIGTLLGLVLMGSGCTVSAQGQETTTTTVAAGGMLKDSTCLACHQDFSTKIKGEDPTTFSHDLHLKQGLSCVTCRRRWGMKAFRLTGRSARTATASACRTPPTSAAPMASSW